MKYLSYISFILLISCSQGQTDVEKVNTSEEISMDTVLEENSGEIYELTLNGSHFVMDIDNYTVKVDYDDQMYRNDSFPDYDMLPFDTLDLNLDGHLDVKFEYMEPGYFFEAWYIWDPDNHYHSTLPFRLEYPRMLDSAKLILFTQELIGMDGDYSSEIIKIVAGVPVGYGRIEKRNIYHEDGDWHNEVHIFNSSNTEVTDEFFQDKSEYQGFELDQFWKANYLTFMQK